MPNLRLLLLLAPAVAGCARKDAAPPAPGAPVPIESATFSSLLGVDLSKSTKTPSGLYYRDLVVGTGEVVKPGQTAAVRYTGWLSNGMPFDSNADAGPPLSFTVGAGGVIAGWDEGVPGMHVGGKRQLIIPPDLGYGPAGNGPIPPNAIMVFTVEVVAVQ